MKALHWCLFKKSYLDTRSKQTQDRSTVHHGLTQKVPPWARLLLTLKQNVEKVIGVTARILLALQQAGAAARTFWVSVGGLQTLKGQPQVSLQRRCEVPEEGDDLGKEGQHNTTIEKGSR